MNELFAGELSDDDKLNYARTIRDKVMENEKVVQQLRTNTKEQAMLGDFPVVMSDAIIESMDAHKNMATQVLSEDKIKEERLEMNDSNDDVAGLGVGLYTSFEDDAENNKMFESSKPGNR